MYDYIVIGSGFGGSVTALRLVEKGYSVLVIEKAGFMMGRNKYDRLNPEDILLKQVAEEMSRTESFDNVQVGIFLDENKKERNPYFKGLGPKRKPCTECAGCMAGCRENAKNSLYKNYLYFAEKMGAEILAETRAIKIKCNRGEYLVKTRSSTSLFRKKPDDITHIEVVKYPDGSNALNWSTGLVILLVMQHIENAMSMKWKRTIFGGKMIIDNMGNNKVPAYIDIGQKVMESYAQKSGGIAQNVILEVLFNRSTTAKASIRFPLKNNWKKYHDPL